ncbi:SDR family oxidoreductase [Methylobacterium sp. E-041]|uniref:SDR family oxidoreductase n=1 Tax=unclassified Methylobacterium TaxID=2615210 RepID=UPI0011CC16DB|nr:MULTISPECIES: SDR family oxidoreductase [unclassified Methylobacterium]MCJ2104971.1 SDR family oxidoreductase [Methylobacterium sp. E-041]MCJ2114804.1 SDR family oxidoreductase [Methylobacterium sp. E-025]TXN65027.1 SDR family oxidoreductase [Methylobacterium sp. WL6]
MAELEHPSARNALIVGASRGLGLGLVETFLGRGWRVTATQRKASPGLAALESEALTIETADIDDDQAVSALHDRLASRTFDLVFVVAGVATQAHDPLHAVPRPVAAQVYLTNAISPVRFAEAFRDRLAPGGSLVFMSSILGSVGLNTSGGWENYRASKAALNTLVRSFAIRHAAENLSVVLMHPGWVRTEMGGDGADIDVATSVAGMADVIEARLGRPGTAYLDYRGETLAW